MSEIIVRNRGRSAKAALPAQKKQRTKTKPKKKQPRKRPSRQRAVNQRMYASTMKKCSYDYARALMDPFDASLKESPPCIPDLLDLPSQKFCTVLRGALILGTGGIGFIKAYPFSFSNAVTALQYSGSTFASSALELPAGVPTGALAAVDSNYPWSTGAERSVRLVACGLRVRYIGTELERSGTIWPVVSSSQGDNITGTTTISNRPDSFSYPCDRKWRQISFRAMWPDAYSYSTSPGAYNDTSVRLGFAISGQSQQQYEFEFIRYFEAQDNGNKVVMGVSASHSDVSGLSHVRDYLGQVATTAAGTGLWQDFQSYLRKTAVGVVESSLNTIVPGLGTVGSRLLTY